MTTAGRGWDGLPGNQITRQQHAVGDRRGRHYLVGHLIVTNLLVFLFYISITYTHISYKVYNTMTTRDPSHSPSYTIPTKYILTKAHLAAFQRSKTYSEIFGFIDELNEDIVGKKLTEAGEGSEVCQNHILYRKRKKLKSKMTFSEHVLS